MKRPALNEIVLLLCAVLLCTACSGLPDSSTNSIPAASPSPTVQPTPLTGFEKDLQFIRNGRFTYVYVFSRKDGKPLDAQDGAFLRANAPQVVDWVTTDEGKKVIAGTNFNLEEGNMEKLKNRFVTEDYSGR
ncbi:MAG TPA: hypothetical protein VJM50_06570 [Pyrinomonadaceae bacterium]|nr:hypothetical protein [Pyrinomonadaceae bacterium]